MNKIKEKNMDLKAKDLEKNINKYEELNRLLDFIYIKTTYGYNNEQFAEVIVEKEEDYNDAFINIINGSSLLWLNYYKDKLNKYLGKTVKDWERQVYNFDYFGRKEKVEKLTERQNVILLRLEKFTNILETYYEILDLEIDKHKSSNDLVKIYKKK
jgi:hypothetical protein